MAARSVLVFGANGALGRDVVSTFAKKNWAIFSIDVTPIAEKQLATLGSASMNSNLTLEEMQTSILKSLPDAHKFDAIINVAGGWAGGSASDVSTAAAADLMIRQSVYSSVVAAHIAATRCNPNSFTALTGAAAAMGPTPGMLGYGLAKAAVHHIVKSVAADPKGLPEGAAIIGVLPATLDTPGNRAGMPDADFGSWTPTATAAADMLKWSEGIERPASGSLAIWETAKGITTVKF